MKFVFTAFLFSLLYFSVVHAATFEETQGWEVAAETYLNIPDLEIYDLNAEVLNSADNSFIVEFKYDKEFFDQGYDVAIYECFGTGFVENEQATFLKLTCEEKEPTLWDEF